MTSRPTTRVGGMMIGAAVAVAALAAPAAAATASPRASTAAAVEECQIAGGTMSWGVKESFRSYISGSIANGAWETSDDVSYETPNFTWQGATGTLDPVTGTGTVSFEGNVHFTGHDGVLDLTLANPTIEFEGAGKAALLIDAKSTDMEGATTIDTAQEWVGEVAAPRSLAPQNDALQLDTLSVTLTNSGVAAFAGFYEAGAELDSIALELEFEACDSGAAAPAAPAETATPEAPADSAVAEARVPWLPIIVGGIALIVIAVTGGMLIGGRQKRAGTESAANEAAEETSPGQ